MRRNVILAGAMVIAAVSLCACGKEKPDLAENEVMIEDVVVEVSEEGLKNAAQELDGVTDADVDANTVNSISLEDCRLWTTFDDFVPVTDSFCDEIRFSFLFPRDAVDVGNGKIRLEGAAPTDYMVLVVEQTAHSSRYENLIYEQDGKRIYKTGDALDGKYLYFIEPDSSNWMNVELLVVGDTNDQIFTDFSTEFIAAFENSLIESIENTGNTVQTEEETNATADAQSFVFADMIGEYTASDGTKLWIATPFGEYDYVKGPITVEFIKEHDIAWTDTGVEFDGNRATCYCNDGRMVYITKTGENTITLELFNGDVLDYTLTNAGYNYNDF